MGKGGYLIKSSRPSREGGWSRVIAWENNNRTYHVSHIVVDKDSHVVHQDTKYNRWGNYHRGNRRK